MVTTIAPHDPPVIWALLDDRAGNRSQVLGVAEALGQPYIEKHIAYRSLAKAPNAVLGARLIGISQESQQNLTGPWPDVVIGAGRRIAPVARWIKKQTSSNPILVQIMDPGGHRGDFDVLAIPSHDAWRSSKNDPADVVRFVGAPHRFTPDVLRAAEKAWSSAFADLPHPRIAVIVGGSTKRKTFTAGMARSLGDTAKKWARESGGSLFVTTSRRTSPGATKALMASIGDIPAYVHQWGDDRANPYVGILAVADHIVVTGESVSMCAEATSSGKPVSIFAPPALISAKHARLHHALFAGRHAHPIEAGMSVEAGSRLDASQGIVRVLQEIMVRRGLSNSA